MLRISNHALRQYCIRTGTPLINSLDAKKELQESLKTAKVLSHKEALEQGFTIRPNQKDTLKMWHNNVIDTDICAIIRDDVLVTIVLPYREMFTRPINDKCRKDLMHINIATKGRYKSMKAGEIYKVEIGFEGERHCLRCPLREKADDSCNLQKLGDENLQFNSWESQMAGCPLRFDREVHC